MTILKDVLDALDRIDIWKRLKQVPDEVDDLTARITELEDKLGDKWPADVCRKCGARASRLYSSMGTDKHGYVTENWVCGECNFNDMRRSLPK